VTQADDTRDEPPITDQLLAYLDENPQAQDTLEGLVWWLLERRARFYTTRVKEAIAELVAQGLVLERQGPDGQIHYRLNPRRRRQIRARLKQS
jgi:hypothetical protein